MKSSALAICLIGLLAYPLVGEELISNGTVLAAESVPQKKIPSTLDEAITELDTWISDPVRERILSGKVKAIDLHFSIGMGLRNEWKLWHGSPLAKYFNDIGIMDPDAMSDIVLTTYFRKLRSEPLDIEKQVKRHRAYWDSQKPIRDAQERAMKKPNQTPEPTPTAVTPDADASVAPSAGAAHL